MSHILKTKCYVTNLSIADKVGRKLGFTLMRNATEFASAAGRGASTCEHKLTRTDKAKGAYEIGLQKRKDGGKGWEAVYDPWSTGGRLVEDLAGPGLRKLKQGMAEEIIAQDYARQGYQLVRTVRSDGSIKLTGMRA